MAAAAHTKGGFGGVPQAVGKEFAAADKAKGDEEKGARRSRLYTHPRSQADE